MNTFVIHRAHEVKISKPRKTKRKAGFFYWQSIEITSDDGHIVKIDIESDEPLFKERKEKQW